MEGPEEGKIKAEPEPARSKSRERAVQGLVRASSKTGHGWDSIRHTKKEGRGHSWGTTGNRDRVFWGHYKPRTEDDSARQG